MNERSERSLFYFENEAIKFFKSNFPEKIFYKLSYVYSTSILFMIDQNGYPDKEIIEKLSSITFIEADEIEKILNFFQDIKIFRLTDHKIPKEVIELMVNPDLNGKVLRYGIKKGFQKLYNQLDYTFTV